MTLIMVGKKQGADISLWPSGLVRPRTDMMLQPNTLVEADNYSSHVNHYIFLLTSYLRKQYIYLQIFINCHLATFCMVRMLKL